MRILSIEEAYQEARPAKTLSKAVESILQSNPMGAPLEAFSELVKAHGSTRIQAVLVAAKVRFAKGLVLPPEPAVKKPPPPKPKIVPIPAAARKGPPPDRPVPGWKLVRFWGFT